MLTYLAQNSIQFNGVINVLHVDETAIGGKKKYHRGAFRKVPHWLFGIVDKINHKILLRFIENEDKLTIFPIIYQHVQRGTTVNSDGAKVYKGLMHMGFVHKDSCQGIVL